MSEDTPQVERYSVVVNHEEQYSIWREGRPLPDGWSAEGVSGTEEECLERIEKIWVDMRPLSLRIQMDQRAVNSAG